MSKRKPQSSADAVSLSPAMLHILLCLAPGERHGYALKREIARRTDGRVTLGPGALYGSIAKLLDHGLIEESEERPDPHLDDERRRYYRLTSHGREVAKAEVARMRDLVDLASASLGLRPRTT